jgi:Flp pilus assembly protein TadD
VLRSFFFALLCASISGTATGLAQDFPADAPQHPATQVPAVEAAAPSETVLAAEAAISKSDWKTAETRLNAWLAAHATDARALFDAGYVADAQNRTEAAEALYRRAVAANPASMEAHLSLGLLLARENKVAEARTELEATTQLEGGALAPALKARAWRALARIDRPTQKNGDTTAATNDLLEALKISPETPNDTLLAAELAEQAGQFDVAETAYRRVLAKDAHSAQANAGLAHLLIRKKQFAEAETFLRAALEKTPDDPTLTAQLALVLAAEDKAEALPLLQKLHTAHPENAAVTRMLAEVLAEAGDIAGSDQLYVKLLASMPTDADLLVAHGQNLVRLGRFAEAVAAFDKATQHDARNADAWSGLAFAAARVQQPAVTLRALGERAKLAPESASTYFLWATAYDALHKKPEAIAAYRHFIDAAAGKFPDQLWQAKQRLQLLEK